MLKVRIIPTMLLKGTGLVKGIGFDSWRRVGTVMPALKVYNTRDVDELILVDIAATPTSRKPDYVEVQDCAAECRVPFTFGGGITTADDVRMALKFGADKVCINSAAYDNLGLIRESAAKFGVQCIVASVDVRYDATAGRHVCHSHAGQKRRDLSPREWAVQLEANGAGEILLTSVERDGTMEGYDIDLIRQVAGAVKIPVIASGGCGSYEHMYQAIVEGGASAVAAASIFHFTQQTPLEAKKYLASKGVAVRLFR